MKYFILIFFLLIFSLGAVTKSSIKLDVPLVKQGKNLCGPATIEMIFKYWGENRYNQYDIAAGMLKQFSTSKRYKKSGILDSQPFDWLKYPGTGTINMREFLKRFAKTKNHYSKLDGIDKDAKAALSTKMFNRLKRYLSRKIPVIVHQYSSFSNKSGHYRVVTGYNDNERLVYLNDSNGGKKIIQSYEDFVNLWNYKQKWLHYNMIAFNLDKKKLKLNL
jgi:hypothetical protein